MRIKLGEKQTAQSHNAYLPEEATPTGGTRGSLAHNQIDCPKKSNHGKGGGGGKKRGRKKKEGHQPYQDKNKPGKAPKDQC